MLSALYVVCFVFVVKKLHKNTLVFLYSVPFYLVDFEELVFTFSYQIKRLCKAHNVIIVAGFQLCFYIAAMGLNSSFGDVELC